MVGLSLDKKPKRVNNSTMQRIILLSLLVILAGCATPIKIKSINYSSQPPNVILYEEPEIIFKDEHTPGSCRSPFR